MYEDYGTKTCMGYPGVIHTMELDAATFAKWDVDYVKLDGCYADIKDMNYGYPEFGRLLNATGRPMIYSCSWPVYQEEKGLMVSGITLDSINSLATTLTFTSNYSQITKR